MSVIEAHLARLEQRRRRAAGQAGNDGSVGLGVRQRRPSAGGTVLGPIKQERQAGRSPTGWSAQQAAIDNAHFDRLRNKLRAAARVHYSERIDLTALFSRFDEDHSGGLGMDEFVEHIEALVPAALSLTERRQVSVHARSPPLCAFSPRAASLALLTRT